MAAVVSADVDHASGWAQLTFPYDPDTIAVVKGQPGAKWNPENKSWLIPVGALELLKEQIRVRITYESAVTTPPLTPMQLRLRPYQIEGAQFLLAHPHALLSMEQRTGKTVVALQAIEALFASNKLDGALIIYPAGVRENWRAQIRAWTGRTMIGLETLSNVTDSDIEWMRQNLPQIMLGCHWEILEHHEEDIHRIFEGRRFLWIGDEIHAAKNRKSGRYRALRAISEAPNCIHRWGLSGTPQRNYPRDLWAIFDVIQPDCMGKYWTFAKAFAGAYQGEYGWIDKGTSRPEELAARLKAFSFRVTRADVAPWLPKSQREVILCSMPAMLSKQYTKLENALATKVRSALSDAEPSADDREALKQLALCTSEGKIPTVIERVLSHAEGRGVKCLVFAHHHEVLEKLEQAMFARYDGDAKDPEQTVYHPPYFVAGGWLTPAKRHAVVEAWRAHEGPSILLANTLSVSVGIDLSDADTAIFLEFEWVPSDFAQAHDRIQDLHLGKRTTPPLYEYLVVKDTIDTHMAATLLSKMRSIHDVVGKDSESAGLASTIRNSGMVNGAQLTLASTDKETVQATLMAFRAQLLGDRTTTESDVLAAELADNWDLNEETDPEAQTLSD